MADLPISGLTAASSALAADEMEVNEAGTSKKITITQLGAAIRMPTAPTVVSVGTEFHSTGVPTATLPPTHAANDILVLIIQSSNDSQVAAPTGYTQCGPQNGIGAAAAAGSVKLSVFTKRDNGSESAPTLTDTGDHTYGVMLAIRGAKATGRSFHFGGVAWKFATSTSATGPNSATWVDNVLVLDIFAQAIDTAGAQASAEANTNLTSLTEQFDGSTTDGTGGGITVVSGLMATAGTVAATTLTWAATSVDLSMRLHFIPADANYDTNAAFPEEIYQFIGSPADLDDAFLKPAGARRIFAQTLDGGGSGSSGQTGTAEGGGGGGGGGYDEAWFNADDLGNSTTVHAGKGGAATASLGAAGNAGVISEFGKGGHGPLTTDKRVAGTAATGAISGTGGAGGCGSGRGVNSPAVGARIDLNASGAALGAVGAKGGGPGAATPVAGSPAEWGGGGGAGGADTDAGFASTGNGWSTRGGGGGSGGRTTTTDGSGAGGGAAGKSASQGQAGGDSAYLPFGGSGGVGGGTTTPQGGQGGFPGGGGGGGGGAANGFGGAGGHGMVQVTVYF